MKYSTVTFVFGFLTTGVLAAPQASFAQCKGTRGVCDAQGNCQDISGGGAFNGNFPECAVGSVANAASSKATANSGATANVGSNSGKSVIDQLGAQFDAPATGDLGQVAASKDEGELCNRNKGQCDGNGGCADIGGGGTIPDATCK